MSTKKTTQKNGQSLPSGDQAMYITRPKGKPDVTTKGKLNEWQNGYKEFIPQGQKPSNRTMLKQLGNSSFYKSEGEKDSSYSLHLNVNGKSEDPVAEMLEQFLILTEGQRKQLPKLPEGSEGRMLMDNGMGLKIWLDRERGKVSILTELNCGPDIERQLLQAQSQMGVCVARNRQEIIKVRG
ncbi:MAG: hypothetical protein IJ604_05250 [Prevotella sp.]|nr:hypothetical protein [Prevotella sp.]